MAEERRDGEKDEEGKGDRAGRQRRGNSRREYEAFEVKSKEVQFLETENYIRQIVSSLLVSLERVDWKNVLFFQAGERQYEERGKKVDEQAEKHIHEDVFFLDYESSVFRF